MLGSGQFIPGFEEQLVGAKAGDEVTVNVTFPDDYSVERLKGQAAEFEVKVKEVKAPVEAAGRRRPGRATRHGRPGGAEERAEGQPGEPVRRRDSR